LALVSVLAVGDYLLWNWSLGGNHDVLALASGLTLPPQAIACIWLVALSIMRLFAHSVNRSRTPPRAEVRRSQGIRAASASHSDPAETGDSERVSTPTTGASPPSRGKLAA
jgi:hypothetical protein